MCGNVIVAVCLWEALFYVETWERVQKYLFRVIYANIKGVDLERFQNSFLNSTKPWSILQLPHVKGFQIKYAACKFVSSLRHKMLDLMLLW